VPKDKVVDRLIRSIDAAAKSGFPIDVDELTGGWDEDDREDVHWLTLDQGPSKLPYTRKLVVFEWDGPASSSESWDLLVLDSTHAYISWPRNEDLHPWLLTHPLKGADDRDGIVSGIDELLVNEQLGGFPSRIRVDPELVPLDAFRPLLKKRFDGSALWGWGWADVLDALTGVERERMQRLTDAITKPTEPDLTDEEKDWIVSRYLA